MAITTDPNLRPRSRRRAIEPLPSAGTTRPLSAPRTNTRDTAHHRQSPSISRTANLTDNPIQTVTPTHNEAKDLDRLFDVAPYETGPTYTPEQPTAAGGKKRGFFYRQRKKLLVAALIAAIGGYSGFFFLSGPLQLVHFAQLLTGFHLSSNQEAETSRLTRLMRVLTVRDPRVRRLGKFKSVAAFRYLDRLKSNGIEIISTSEDTGFFKEARVDSTKVDISELQKDKSLSVTPHVDANGQQSLIEYDVRSASSTPGIKEFQERGLLTKLLNLGGYGKILSATHSRLLRKFYAVSFHPSDILAKKINEKVDEIRKRYSKERSDELETGKKNTTVVGPGKPDENASDQEKRATQVGQEAADNAQQMLDFDPGATPTERIETVKSRFGLKVLGGTAAVVGVLCTLKGIGDQADQLQYANVVLPLIRTGWRAITFGGQIMSGEDLDINAVAEEASHLYDPGTPDLQPTDPNYRAPSSAINDAMSIQHELNPDQPLTGQDIPESAKLNKQGNFISDILGNIPFLDQVCSASGSVLGTITFGAIDFATGGAGGFAVGQAVNIIQSQVIERTGVFDNIARLLAGEAVNTDAAGAVFGNFANYGARLAANGDAMAMGGRVLTGTETTELNQVRDQEQRDYANSRGLGYKLFALDNPYSLASTGLAELPSPQAVVQKLATLPATVFQTLATSFKTLFAPAQAATSYNYGFPKIGFSEAELNNPTFDNPDDNAAIVEPHLSGTGDNNWNEKYGQPCFGITLTESGFSASTPPADRSNSRYV